jgi:hypothetical protein
VRQGPPPGAPQGRAEGFQRREQAPALQGQNVQRRDQAPAFQGQRFQGRDQGQAFQGQRFQAPPANADPQRFGRFGENQARRFDHERGPNEVVPPRSGGWDGRRDNRGAPGGFEARGARPGDGQWQNGARDGRWAGGADHWRGEHWRPGHYPPVFWSHERFRIGAYRAPYGFFVRSWAFGDILPRGWYGPDYFIDDFLDFGLPYPPPGYEWVRVGPDALMIDQYTGRIVQVVRGIFW